MKRFRKHYGAVFLALCLALTSAGSMAGSSWNAADFSLEMGTATALASGLQVTPNESGQVYIVLPASGIKLAEQYLLTLQFATKPPPVIFIIWHNDKNPQQPLQYRLPLQEQNPVVFNMSEIPGWEGTATRLGIGLRLTPGHKLLLRSVSLDSPTLLSGLTAVWRNWTYFRPWKQVDINIHTGTRRLFEGPHPVPFFALLALFATLAYVTWAKVRSGNFSLRAAGTIVLCLWIVSDVFWQMRLWRQAHQTLDQFGGMDTTEKLLASSDANLVRFTAAAKAKISESDARVFIASTSDYTAMRSAYYLSPLNTYWHRMGPELPPTNALAPGDYLLLVAPSSIRYHARDKLVRYKQGEPIPVETIFKDQQGLLLRVAP